MHNITYHRPYYAALLSVLALIMPTLCLQTYMILNSAGFNVSKILWLMLFSVHCSVYVSLKFFDSGQTPAY